jgi:predicted DNA-binding antitoxin AbrB/MazE fold protein
MTRHIQAIFENGLLRPLEPLQLPEHQRVRISINSIVSESDDLVARQRAAFADLDAELAQLTDGGRSQPPPISELDQSLYGRP